MSRGWAIGSPDFKKSLKESHSELVAALKRGDQELGEWREEQQASVLNALLAHLGQDAQTVATDAKGALWKVAIAAEMKRRTNASNPWLARQLNMGSPFRVSRLTAAFDQHDGPAAQLRQSCAMCKVF